MLKLNLASGTDLKDGWVNLDVVPKWPSAPRGCDVVWDARKDRIPYDDGTVDEIYAGYLFLHLAPVYHQAVLTEIRRVLRDGAVLVVGEVAMEVVMPRWLADPENRQLAELIWGEQGERAHGLEFAEFDKHCWGFTEEKLVAFLKNGGFRDIRRIRIHHADVFYELTLDARK